MRYVLGPTLYEKHKGFSVRIANDLRKAIAFLGEELADDRGRSAIDPRATGFFVTWASDSCRPIESMQPEQAGVYLVTARHVAEPLGRNFAIRFNRNDGGSDVDLVTDAKWTTHEDKTVDVAVLQCGYPAWADCIPIPGRMLALPTAQDVPFAEYGDDDLVVRDPNLGIGDIAYVVGLFNVMAGKGVNLPVVHTGHIALLPGDERVSVYDSRKRRRQDVEAYLVEAHGLDGLSGAPVFARTSSPVTAPYRYEMPMHGNLPAYPIPGRLHGFTVLLGLWQASWGELATDAHSKARNIPKDQKVPLGMGVVVPSSKIAETLNREDLVMARRQEYERRASKNAAVMDSLPPSDTSPRASDANPNHREDFTRLVGAAARKPPQED
jgi:hypothetical protein